MHSVYVPNGRSLDSEHYEVKLAWLARLRDYLAADLRPGRRRGGLRRLQRRPDRRRRVGPRRTSSGPTHVSGPERAALASLIDWGLVDVFRRHHPEGGIFSWWDYRAGDFHKGQGMRIDLVLLDAPALAGRCTRAGIDREARKKSPAGNKPSDHTPVVVDLEPT